MTHDPESILWQPNPGPQTRALASGVFELGYGGGAGGGKMLRLDEPVPTPRGWSSIGDLSVGDELFTERGDTCRVLALHPVDPSPVAYRLTFDDGTTIEACADHRWITFTAAELRALTQRSVVFSAAVSERNRTAPPPAKAAPAGTVRTTRQIAETLTVRGRRNHAIPVAAALQLPEASLPLDPYLLGVWLGDGNTRGGRITSADPEVFAAFEATGFMLGVEEKNGNSGRARTRGVLGLQAKLRGLGVLGNKHVPASYLRASAAQRLALLQGLLDTDGTVTESGSVEFTTTKWRLARAAHELIVSLGWKARIVEGRATLNGLDCGPKWDVKWTPSEFVFRLPRKRSRQRLASRRTTQFRYIVACDPVPGTPMRCITVDNPTGLFLASRSMVPTHNTDWLLAIPYRWCHVRGFRGIIFRRTFGELEEWVIPRSFEMYKPVGGDYNQSKHRWTFYDGAGNPCGRIQLGHLQHDKDVLEYRGAPYQYAGFDELPTFSSFQYTYFVSRLRSAQGIPIRLRSSMNPEPGWVRDRFAPWVRTSPEYQGPRVGDGAVLWFLTERGAERYVPKGTTGAFGRQFIKSALEDNPHLHQNDPDYVHRLSMLDPVQYARLRENDWETEYSAGLMFQRGWFPLVMAAPAHARRVRFWDRAATEEKFKGQASLEPRAVNDPDWTVGVLLAREGDGTLRARTYVEDVVRLRGKPGDVMETIKRTAELDEQKYGRFGFTVLLEQEPGASGVSEIAAYMQLLARWHVVAVPATKGMGNKIVRAGPVSAQAKAGNIPVVRGAWNGAFLGELEAFPKGRHDDQVDGLSGGHNWLTSAPSTEGGAVRGERRALNSGGF